MHQWSGKAIISAMCQMVVTTDASSFDNKVTQAYINHLGGRSPFLNSIAQDLWSMCYRAHILLIAVHRPSKVNVRADRLFRWKHDHTDIRLEPKVFKMIDRRYGLHSMDLFATHDN